MIDGGVPVHQPATGARGVAQGVEQIESEAWRRLGAREEAAAAAAVLAHLLLAGDARRALRLGSIRLADAHAGGAGCRAGAHCLLADHARRTLRLDSIRRAVAHAGDALCRAGHTGAAEVIAYTRHALSVVKHAAADCAALRSAEPLVLAGLLAILVGIGEHNRHIGRGEQNARHVIPRALSARLLRAKGAGLRPNVLRAVSLTPRLQRDVPRSNLP